MNKKQVFNMHQKPLATTLLTNCIYLSVYYIECGINDTVYYKIHTIGSAEKLHKAIIKYNSKGAYFNSPSGKIYLDMVVLV